MSMIYNNLGQWSETRINQKRDITETNAVTENNYGNHSGPNIDPLIG